MEKETMNFWKSPYSMELQSSKYISISTKPTKNAAEHAQPPKQEKEHASTAKVSGQIDFQQLCKQLNIQFLKTV
jgi:uncharacterized protein YbcV (DUF1398 family)